MSVESHKSAARPAPSESGENVPLAGADLTARRLAEARSGSREAVGLVVNACRDYLLLVANEELPDDVRQKVAASDLVQQTLAEAFQAFDRFTGNSDAEVRAWLRRILLNNLIDTTRGFRSTGKRDLLREVPLAAEESNGALVQQLIAGDASPSACAIAAEEHRALLAAINRLAVHYAQVIRLRNLEYRSFAEIGEQMQLSQDSARKLWERAIHQLSRALEPDNGRT